MEEPSARSSQSPLVSRPKKICYGFGAAADMIGFHAPAALIMPIYTLVLGVSPALVGVAIAITRIWDALLDPVMGALSDKTRSRFGRRRPYIFLGAILGGIAFALMWQMPRGWSETSYFVYLTVSLLVFYSAFTIYTVPFHALGYELTPDYHERTRVMAYRMFFNMIGNICAQWLLAATQLDFFEDTLQGSRVVGPLAGLTFIIFGIVPALSIVEKHEAAPKKESEHLPIIQSLLATLKDKPFRLLLGLTVIMLTGGTIVSSFTLYLNVSYVYKGDLEASSIMMGILVLIQTGATALALPLASWISGRVGKRGVMIISFSVQVVYAISTWFLITPSYPYLQVPAAALGAFAIMTYFLMLHSMTSDICDRDELKNGLRREGMYGAAITWVQKLCVSIGIALSGFVLVWIGFDQEPGALQSADTILYMRIFFTGTLLLIGISGLILLPRYRLTEERVLEIQEELGIRRAGK